MKFKNNSEEVPEIDEDWKEELEEYINKEIEVNARNASVNKESKLLKTYNKFGYLYILIDTSGSMNVQDKINQAKRGAISFIEQAYNMNFKTGIIKFASEPVEIANFDCSLKTLESQLYRVEAEGNTNLQSALILAGNRLKKLAGKKVVYVITDGRPDNNSGAASEAEILKRNGVIIMTLGTKDADEAFLKEISSDENLNKITSNEELEENISNMSSYLPEDID